MQAVEVRAIRHKLGLTQEDFAYLLGATASTISRWERGDATPSKAYLKVLLRLQDSSSP